MPQGKLFTQRKLPPALGQEPLFAIDGSSFIYRAYFAIRGHLSNSKGLPTKAIFGFTQMILKLLKDWEPKYVALCLDAKGPTFRHEVFKEYKANRPVMPEDLAVQLPYIKEIARAFGLTILEIQGFEADDLIATLATKLKHPLVIVGGDKDLFPLVRETVIIWDPVKDTLITDRDIQERFGLPPQKLLDVRALCGDAIDNIPGVPGIGEKTALKLIKEFGSLDEVLARAQEIKQKRLREKLLEHADKARLSRELISLRTDAPIPLDLKAYRLQKRDLNTLRRLFRELEFKKLLKELPPQKTLSYEGYRLINQIDELKAVLSKAQKAQRLVIDVESTHTNAMQGQLIGLALCFDPHTAYYLPFAHQDKTLSNLSLKARDLLKPLLADPCLPKIGHNIKYDLIILQRHGLELQGLAGDTMVASYVLNPTRHSHALDELAEEILGHHMISYKEVTSSLSKDENFAAVPLKKAYIYACEDAHVTYLLYEKLWAQMQEEGLLELYQRIEHPLIQVLARMEMAGIRIDVGYLSNLSKQMAQELKTLEEKIYALAGEKFNLNSSVQLGYILFEKIKLPSVKRTKKTRAHSTDTEVLEALSDQHPLPKLILRYRTLAKLKSTYVDALPRLVHPATGRIHTSFNQTITATGRLSSSEPNLQNIPARGQEGPLIRRAFVPEEGFLFLSADYSQIDLRVLAHYSADKNLIEAFRKGEDIHRRTAAEIFGIAPEEVTSDMRRMAKTINFGIVYGMSPYGLAKELKIGHQEAKAFIERYFQRYPGVKKYMEEIVTQAREKGYVTTLFGRKRPLPDINSPNRVAREFAERTAINTPIQGTAADIIKLAMIAIDRLITQQKLKTRMLLQVHDELLFEVPPEEVEVIQRIVREKMEGVVKLAVPLVVNLAVGKNWAEAKA